MPPLVTTGVEQPASWIARRIAAASGTLRPKGPRSSESTVGMEPSDFVHDPQAVAQLDRFVAINSALEIDLTGQVTAESLGPRQVAGIGGQFDFVLGASRSRGGAAIIALPSTGRDGAVSRIMNDRHEAVDAGIF